MKKLLVLISISLVFVFSSCEKIFDDINPGKDYDKYAYFYLAIHIDVNESASLSYNVVGDPDTGMMNVDLGFVDNKPSLDTPRFKLPLDTYEGKTIKVQLYRGNTYSDSKYRSEEDVVVKKKDDETSVRFRIYGGI
jgi:hypothetical protein